MPQAKPSFYLSLMYVVFFINHLNALAKVYYKVGRQFPILKVVCTEEAVFLRRARDSSRKSQIIFLG